MSIMWRDPLGPSCVDSRMLIAFHCWAQVLSTLSQWVDEVPPSTQALRYGNLAFRTWNARVADQSESLMRGVLPPDKCDASIDA